MPQPELRLRNLCVLCGSVVKENAKQLNRRAGENAEITQRKSSNQGTPRGGTGKSNPAG